MSQVNPNGSENDWSHSNRGPDAPPGKPTLAGRTAEQVQGILSAADRQADDIRRQVEEWAKTRVRDIEDEALRYLDEAKAKSEALLSERLDPIVALGTLVEERAERLISLLEETESIKAELRDLIQDLRQGPSVDTAPLPDRTVRDEVPAAAASFARATAETPPWRRDAPAEHRNDEGVGLVALQMAIEGGTRSEVERKIRDEFDVRDPQAILDEVFGAGTPGSHSIAWNMSRRIG